MPGIDTDVAVIKNDMSHLKEGMDTINVTMGDIKEILRKQNEHRIRMEVIQEGHDKHIKVLEKNITSLQALKNKAFGIVIVSSLGGGSATIGAFKALGMVLK